MTRVICLTILIPNGHQNYIYRVHWSINDITENIYTCMQYIKLDYNPSTYTAEMLPNLICKMYLDIVDKQID